MEFDPIAYINEPRWQEVRLGLDRIRDLLDRMGRPQDRLKFVHVAGTNGKGSTCAYIAQTLQEAGYRTGLFTSPYIVHFEERIRVDGEDIPLTELREVTLFVREHAEALAAETGEHPTEFELMTAVAFEHFARRACDIVVCEVGLGGKLDSTNVIEAPEACVIARIGLDHTDLLGDTPAAIAGEKAGIIKPGAEVVSWPQDEEGAMEAIEGRARECGCTLTVPDFGQLEIGALAENGIRSFEYRGVAYETQLVGTYQPSNAALAIEALGALARKGWNVSDTATVQRGIANTSWPARFEIVDRGRPPVVIDGGHNPQGIAVLVDSLRDVFPGKPITFIMSVLADKDFSEMIADVLPLANAFVCVTPPNPRALAAADLARVIGEAATRMRADGDAIRDDLPIEVADDFSQALARARAIAGPTGVVCAFGSLYSIGNLKAALA